MLSDYSPHWPILFEGEAKVLREAFAPRGIVVEHIGSTSVPGMVAKPIIDVLLGAASLASIEDAIPALIGTGYRYVPEHESQLPERRYFVKPGTGPALFHVHAVVRGGDFWREHLAFRDALRENRQLFGEYLALKRGLALTLAHDRKAYTNAKAPFIRGVLDRAATKADSP